MNTALIEELKYAALCCQPGGERRGLFDRAIVEIESMQKRLDLWEPKGSVRSALASSSHPSR